MKLIPLDAVLAEIDKRINTCLNQREEMIIADCETLVGDATARAGELQCLRDSINSLEVKEGDFWHKQSEEDIDDSVIGWSMHSFICLMKDGTTQKFTGIQDESYEGSISKHLDCVDDNYEWEYDDIIYWIEVPNIKSQKGGKV